MKSNNRYTHSLSTQGVYMATILIKWNKRKIKKPINHLIFIMFFFSGPILLIKFRVVIVCSCIKWDCRHQRYLLMFEQPLVQRMVWALNR